MFCILLDCTIYSICNLIADESWVEVVPYDSKVDFIDLLKFCSLKSKHQTAVSQLLFAISRFTCVLTYS